MPRTKTVFVDTSGFYALLDGSDTFHPKARDCFERSQAESWQLVTTNYVIHESWAVIQARLGWEAVDAWLDRVLRCCDILWVDPELHALAMARCRQARERRLSLTDCLSIEVMRRRGISEAIAEDEHFAREGFRLP
ncbi:MAG: type II toxin-antitoxin system VapC family toxin [Planctomycetes bacterium]|nr:type II toxin-antitoxin system VapC family toxin [Planctomycetota bacterium]